MVRFQLTLLAALIISIGLSACRKSEEPPRQTIVKDTFEFDGCVIKLVDRAQYPLFYIAKCGDTITTTKVGPRGTPGMVSVTVGTNNDTETN